MPHAADFVAGFGFHNNTSMAGYTLVSASADESTVSRYHEYHYVVRLVFKGRGNYNELVRTVSNQIAQPRTIYGVRNPYSCSIESIRPADVQQTGDGVVFQLVGHAYR
jgi:dTDP-4-dehydrorhamnose reductase